MKNEYEIENILQLMVQAALAGGREIMAFWKSSDISRHVKSDGTPVTNADLASSDVILNILSSAYPDLPILCEETEDIKDSDGIPDRIKKGKCFIVDPLDGTKEFIYGSDEFAVSIAYAEKNFPTAGVIFAPAKDIVYYAAAGFGAYKAASEDLSDVSKLFEKTRIKVSDRTNGLIALCSHSRDIQAMEIYERFKDRISEVRPIGSCLKGCLIADGTADLHYRFSSYTKEWDTAAEQAIAEEAGACVTDVFGYRLSVNCLDVVNRKGIRILNRAESALE